MIDLDVMYAILASVARQHSQLTYGQLSQHYFDHTGDWHEPQGSWDGPLGELNRSLNGIGWPPISAVVVLQETREPGGGFWGSSPNIPARPADEVDRISSYGQVLAAVHEAHWPETMPVAPPP